MAEVDVDEYWIRVWETIDGNAVLHRVDGPAAYRRCGAAWWFVDSDQHRIDGPAVDYPNGYKMWHNEGYKVWPIL